MPSKPSTPTGVPERTSAETNHKDLISGETQRREAAVQLEQVTKARRKRYRERQREKKSKEEGSAATSIATGVGAETRALATEPPPPKPELKHAFPAISPVEVPVLPRYEFREFSRVNGGKEDTDQGLFATQKIEKGTRVISEQPILTLSAPGDQLDELMSAYQRLSKEEQTMIWNIQPASPNASAQLQDLRFIIDRLVLGLKTIILKPRADRSESEQNKLDSMAPKVEHAMNTWRLAARWHANRSSLINSPMHERLNLPDGTPITGLFILRAHIRHSCVPNCFASFDDQRGCMNIHVTRDIKKGEELTLAAFADTNYYNNAAERAKELGAWGLTCSCEACDETNPRFVVHEGARERARARAVILNDILTRLDKSDLPDVCISSSPT
jgi:hypothetical protein